MCNMYMSMSTLGFSKNKIFDLQTPVSTKCDPKCPSEQMNIHEPSCCKNLDHPVPGCHRCVCSVSLRDLVRKCAQVNFMTSWQISYGTASFASFGNPNSKRLCLLVAWCNDLIGSTVLKSPNLAKLSSYHN
jgi:hypothetical protein